MNINNEKDAGENDQSASTPAPPDGISRTRRRIFKLAALALPVLGLLLLEIGLHVGGYGYDPDFFVKIAERDAFAGNPKFGWSYFPPAVARMPNPFAVPAEKTPGTYRIFVMGGSAALGTPAPAFGFSRILEVMLRDTLPEVRFEVVNVGMVAINSHVVRAIARDCAAHDPDLYIVYLGNNEVVGPFGLGTVFADFSPNLQTIRAGLWLKRSRIGQAVQNLMGGMAGEQAPLTEWKGMEFFLDKQIAASDPRLPDVYDHFRENLNDICAAARDGGDDALVCTVGVNLKDSAPFASLHRQDLADADKARWDTFYEAGVALETEGRAAEAVAQFLAAAEIDDQFADLQFRLARCRLALGDAEAAREHYRLARDLDALRFRADTGINEVIRGLDVLADEHVHLVDVENILANNPAAPDRLPGRELFHEHCHPTFLGNYVIAEALYENTWPLLPTALRGDGAMPPAPSLERCAELLALTGWDRQRTSGVVVAKLELPPFTNQLDAAEQLTRARDEERALRIFLRPEAMHECANMYEAAIERAPRDIDLRRNYVNLLTKLGELTLAERELRTLLETLPHDVEAATVLGNVLVKQDRIQEGASVLSQALQSPFCDRRRRADICYSLGVAAEKAGDLDQAAEHYRQTLLSSSGDVKAHTNLALVLQRQGNYEEAIPHHRKVIELQPDLGLGHLNLGVTLLEKGAAPEAIEELHAALRLAPDDAQIHSVAASAFLKLGRLEDAVVCLGRAAKLEPGLAPSLLQLGRRLDAAGRPAEARQAAEYLLAATPDDETAIIFAAELYYRQEAPGLAIETLRTGRRRLPESIQLSNTLAWRLATAARDELRDGPEALLLAERVVTATQGGNAAVLDTLAAAYAECGRFEEAAATARQALDLARQNNADALAEQIAPRIMLYENRQAYREP